VRATIPQSTLHPLIRPRSPTLIRRIRQTLPLPLPHLPILIRHPPPPLPHTPILDKLHRREIMLILLHRRHPRHIIERHDLQAEIRVIGDFVDFAQETLDVGGGDRVDGEDKIGRGEAVHVGW